MWHVVSQPEWITLDNMQHYNDKPICLSLAKLNSTCLSHIMMMENQRRMSWMTAQSKSMPISVLISGDAVVRPEATANAPLKFQPRLKVSESNCSATYTTQFCTVFGLRPCCANHLQYCLISQTSSISTKNCGKNGVTICICQILNAKKHPRGFLLRMQIFTFEPTVYWHVNLKQDLWNWIWPSWPARKYRVLCAGACCNMQWSKKD